jgi:ElaB/YqjD/DUF883 family membrane-anchored ribosome-binding protein
MTQQRANYSPDSSTEQSRRPESTLDRMKDAAVEAQEYAGSVAEQARAYGEKAQQAARDFKPYVEKSMKEQPLATLAVVSVVGFVLGALWKK